MYALIAVSAAVYQIDKPFTYLIPECFESTLRPGQRVTVPFGASNRFSEGIVLSLSETAAADAGKIKEIASLLDSEPVMNEAMLAVAAFLRERCFCTFYEAVHAMLPAGVFIKKTSVVSLCPDTAPHALPENVLEIINTLRDLGGSAEVPALSKLLNRDITQDIDLLIRKRIIRESLILSKKESDCTEAILSLAVPCEDAIEEAERFRNRAKIRSAALSLLADAGEISVKELCYFTGASSSTVNRIISDGFAQKLQREVFRRSYTISAAGAPIDLNEEQKYAFNGLSGLLGAQRFCVSLLYGVTGSGKTAVYVKLIRNCLDMGKTAMLLVPEIGLTTQLIERLTSYFGDDIAVLHSRLSIGERYDEWKRIKQGRARVVVGTRSAVFAPLEHPGLFILDEEHDHSYKSENSPRYHAREVAIYRASREKALVLLGSATPAIETMYRAETGAYSLFRLLNRYNGKPVPDAEIIDMKQELRAGNASPISIPLLQAIRENDGKQAILFLNRRGAGRMLVCVSCGAVPDCPNCSAHLTYHRANDRLMCHYCGFSRPAFSVCPECGGALKQVGFGTQQIENTIREMLPGTEVLRMDADTVSATNSHETILQKFRSENIPVLVGTQMVTKGLDFPNVTISGVLDPDSSLYMSHFRASETAFSQITQVIGRAGRGADEGKAFIQTMTPENPVIVLASKQDYMSFYRTELAMRRLHGAPPFRDLAEFGFSGTDEDEVANASSDFRSILMEQLADYPYNMQLLGPAPAPIAKVAGKYRYRMTIGFKNRKESRVIFSNVLMLFRKKYAKKGISVYIDVNPYD